jgi:hypothetical protein
MSDFPMDILLQGKNNIDLGHRGRCGMGEIKKERRDIVPTKYEARNSKPETNWNDQTSNVPNKLIIKTRNVFEKPSRK